MAQPETRTPRWVKVAGLVTLAIVVLVIVVVVAGGGEHGPSRHTPGNDSDGGHTAPPPGVTHQQP